MWRTVVPAVVAAVFYFLPYSVRQECPACRRKSLRLAFSGLFENRYDWKCPCGYRSESGVVVKTSWAVLAALAGTAVLFAAYMIVRYA